MNRTLAISIKIADLQLIFAGLFPRFAVFGSHNSGRHDAENSEMTKRKIRKLNNKVHLHDVIRSSKIRYLKKIIVRTAI